MKKHALSIWAAGSSVAVLLAGFCMPGSAADLTVSNTATLAAPTVPMTPSLPYGASEVVKMYQGGIGKDVLIGYVEGSTAPFHLNADGIIYLQKLGLPQEVTSAMIRRDSELQRQGAIAAQSQPAQQLISQPVQQPASTTIVMPSTPAPAVNPYPEAVTTAPPMVVPDYTVYPYYGYPYYYDPVIIGGGIGWGWGWGHGWHGGFDHGYHGGFRGGAGFHGGHR